MELSPDEVDYALQPVRFFSAQLKEEVEAYEQRRRGDLGPLFSLTHIGRWLVGARIALGPTQQVLAEWLAFRRLKSLASSGTTTMASRWTGHSGSWRCWACVSAPRRRIRSSKR